MDGGQGWGQPGGTPEEAPAEEPLVDLVWGSEVVLQERSEVTGRLPRELGVDGLVFDVAVVEEVVQQHQRHGVGAGGRRAGVPPTASSAPSDPAQTCHNALCPTEFDDTHPPKVLLDSFRRGGFAFGCFWGGGSSGIAHPLTWVGWGGYQTCH